jgi:hypothetical protein
MDLPPPPGHTHPPDGGRGDRDRRDRTLTAAAARCAHPTVYPFRDGPRFYRRCLECGERFEGAVATPEADLRPSWLESALTTLLFGAVLSVLIAGCAITSAIAMAFWILARLGGV